MPTLHLLPSSGHQTAAILKQNALAMLNEAHALRLRSEPDYWYNFFGFRCSRSLP